MEQRLEANLKENVIMSMEESLENMLEEYDLPKKKLKTEGLSYNAEKENHVENNIIQGLDMFKEWNGLNKKGKSASKK